ncbi:MAG TPA: ribonuclease HI family protein [bacterium]|nr:ribonuclease HI family protein [bacterium]
MQHDPRAVLELLARTLSCKALRTAFPDLTDTRLRAILADAAGQYPAADPVTTRPAAKPSVAGRTRVNYDGASRGNPGPAAAGVVITPPSGKSITLGRVLGTMTNNQAEYRAVLVALRECLQLGFTNLELCLDSELAVRQLNGDYRVKSADLLPLYQEAKRLLARFAHATVRHVPRAENAAADAAANAALDGKPVG